MLRGILLRSRYSLRARAVAEHTVGLFEERFDAVELPGQHHRRCEPDQEQWPAAHRLFG